MPSPAPSPASRALLALLLVPGLALAQGNAPLRPLPGGAPAPAAAPPTAAPPTAAPPVSAPSARAPSAPAQSGPAPAAPAPAAPAPAAPAQAPAPAAPAPVVSAALPAAPGTVPAAPTPAPFAPTAEVDFRRPEVGLMVTQGAFGALTAVGSAGLPWLLYRMGTINGMASQFGGAGAGETLSQVVVLLALAATPMAVSNTQWGIANQSAFTTAEAWPAQLATVGMQAATVGLFYLAGGFPQTGLAGLGRPNGEWVLAVGTLALVPAAGVAALHFSKQPRPGATRIAAAAGPGLLVSTPEGGLALAAPMPVPLLTLGGGTAGAPRVSGLLLPVASGRF